MKIAAYEIENIGIDHSQYFSGRSTVFTKWDSVFVGVGDTEFEALEDALNQVAEDYDNTDIVQNTLSMIGYINDNGDSELYYYVALWIKN